MHLKNIQLVGVLLQPDEPLTPAVRMTVSQPTMDGVYLHLAAYTSHKIGLTQQNYSSQEREALGMVQALQTWQDWIEGCDIIIRTGHESWLESEKNTTYHLECKNS
ncbi:putative krab-a domain-containing protein [Erysiphe necator]|uniref:Putative krab-a domain-containing protein n=1 Tax=Uncinula necator TaxID=52586 RepID=A0A0B1PGG8_UNCNE|nr:putative krab-a domain-containing protein [Erysiphe necator]